MHMLLKWVTELEDGGDALEHCGLRADTIISQTDCIYGQSLNTFILRNKMIFLDGRIMHSM